MAWRWVRAANVERRSIFSETYAQHISPPSHFAAAAGVAVGSREQVLHMRMGSALPRARSGTHALQNTSPQNRQWCRRRRSVNVFLQPTQAVRVESSTQCSPVGVRRKSAPPTSTRSAALLLLIAISRRTRESGCCAPVEAAAGLESRCCAPVDLASLALQDRRSMSELRRREHLPRRASRNRAAIPSRTYRSYLQNSRRSRRRRRGPPETAPEPAS